MESERVLRQALAELEAQRSKLDKAIAAMREVIGEPQQLSVPIALKRSPRKHKRIGERAAEIIRESARPMSTGEIHSALAAQGVKISGTNSLSTILRREPSLVKADRGIWVIGDKIESNKDDAPLQEQEGV